MPLNVRRLNTSIFLVFVIFVSLAGAQTPPQTPPQQTASQQTTPAQTASQPAVVLPQVPAPTSGDIMRGRISKSKAYIAVRNYNAAIYELENLRRETNDPAVHGVINVLLTNSYLEQGDYKRAQDLLTEFYTAQKTNKPNAPASYMAVAGQIVKGARNRVERYRTLGLSVSDRTLPLEAMNDLEKMRETLELVVTQAKEMGVRKDRADDAMALIEEASSSRSMLARDDYDSRRWSDEVSDTREKMMNTGTVVLNAVNDGTTLPADTPLVASNITGPAGGQLVMQPVAEVKTGATRERQVVPGGQTVAQNTQPVYIPSAKSPQEAVMKPNVGETVPTPNVGQSASTPNVATPNVAQSAPVKQGTEPDDAETKPKMQVPVAGSTNEGPMSVGSLVAYATSQTPPVYPQAAKSFRTTGIVKVEVMVDEKGEVSEVQKASGPSVLQNAAKDAIRRWKFKPFVRDGQPVRATGFVNFNFAL